MTQGQPVRSIIVTSNFPPVRGGSCVVYDRIAKFSQGAVLVLAPKRDFKTGEELAGVDAHDRAAAYKIFRLPVLRPYETPAMQRLPRPLRLIVDLLIMLRVFLVLAWIRVTQRVQVVCIGDLVYGGWLIWPSRTLLRCRTTVYIHGEELTSVAGGRFERLKTRFLRLADGIVAVSRFAAQAAIDIGKVDAAKVEIIPNGVDLDLFQPRLRKPELAARYRGGPILFTVARLIERKGVDAMIKALPLVIRQFPNVHYIVAGQGPEREALLALRDGLGLQDHVTLVGAISDDSLVDHYALADLFVMPNRQLANGDNEGFGLVFLEANACGKAVIAGDAGGTADAVLAGENGLLVDGTNIGAIAEAVTRLLADDPLRARMAERGLEIAKNSNWTLRAADYAQFLNGLVRPGTAAPSNVTFPIPRPFPIAAQRRDIALPAGSVGKPRLLVMVDAEEEFDWSQFTSRQTSVQSMRHQVRAHRIFERFGLKPSYLVDYPVAAQPDGYLPLRDLLASGACDVGSQLHPWVNPPDERPVNNEAESFPGNLAEALERAKAVRLTNCIQENLGQKPIIYRSGRYGAGPNTERILTDLGYKIDCSVLPYTNLSDRGGPDYTNWGPEPVWLDRDAGLLELPVTLGFTGALAGMGGMNHAKLFRPGTERLHVPGVFARLGLLERIKLTPEGISLAEAKRLTRSLLANGQKVFAITYHSPSLDPGNTPYVRSQADLDRFLAWLDLYCEWFLGAVGGTPSTAVEIYDLAHQRIAVRAENA